MNQPHIDNAPGLKWRPRKHGWEARWRARADLAQRGYRPRNVRLWISTKDFPEPTAIDLAWISDRCNQMQGDMLVWARGGIPVVAEFDGTWRSLTDCYKSDPDSSYHKKRYATRQHYDVLMRRIVKDCGDLLVADTDARKLLRLHEGWSADGKVAMGHAVIGMIRTLATFGATMLKSKDCRAVKVDLHDMRFKSSKPREERLTADQVNAFRAMAHKMGHHSMALAQAIQFDLMLRQKDVIGEWLPLSEKELSDLVSGNEKWVRGIRGEEIDADLVLHHVTSKRDKMLEPDLKIAPMVLEEFRFMAGLGADEPLLRGHIPTAGPIIIQEATGLPYTEVTFRKRWREIATAADIPKTVRNMDSRAGAISEATDAGAQLEDVRHAATHGDIAMTQRYSRGAQGKVAKVMQLRSDHREQERNKSAKNKAGK